MVHGWTKEGVEASVCRRRPADNCVYRLDGYKTVMQAETLAILECAKILPWKVDAGEGSESGAAGACE